MRKTSILCLMLALVTLCGCSKKGDLMSKIEYIPFQAEEDGRWGMISTDGEVLFEGEFTERPSVAINGRFIVQNKKGLYEIYTAEEKPKQVGDAYKAVGSFIEDVAPAVQEGKAVTLIDRDGKVVKELDKLAGKTVDQVQNFQDGIAVFRTSDDFFGAINTKGDVVIEPNYIYLGSANDGKILAVDKKYADAFHQGENDNWKVSVLDASNGKELSLLPAKKLVKASGYFEDDLMACANDDQEYGIMDLEGEWVVKPKDKYKGIVIVNKKEFIFYDGENYGLANLEGETLIRAKYSGLRKANDKLFIANDKSESENEREFFLDHEGERVGNDGYAEIYGFIGSGKYALAQMGEHEYGFIDDEGKTVKLDKGVDIYDVSFHFGDWIVESDKVDMESVVDKLQLTANGMNGFTLGMNPENVAKRIMDLCKEDEEVDASSWKYRGENKLTYSQPNRNIPNFNYEFYFPDYIVKEKTHTEYEDYGGYQFETTKSDGFYFNNSIGLSIMTVNIADAEKLSGKLADLLKAIKNRASKFGKMVQDKPLGFAIDLGNGKALGAMIMGNSLGVCYGEGDAATLPIPDGQYDPTHSSDDYGAGADSCEVDTDVVEMSDSTVAYGY